MASVMTKPSVIQSESEGPVKYDAAQLKLLELVLDKPELKGVAATKLAAVAEELAHGGGKSNADASKKDSGSAIEKLKSGFLSFKTNHFLKEPSVFEPLKTGQHPKVLIIACCDSRVSPDTVLNASPGELFTFRNIANLVPPMEEAGKLHSVSAALEYAVLHLKVEHIIVEGHRACGGINALLTSKPDDKHAAKGHRSYIGDWMDIAAPAKAKTLEACKGKDLDTQLRYLEKESVNNSLQNLLTFPWIKEAVDAGRLQLHGWYYDFVEGALSAWTVQNPAVEKLQ